MKIIAMVRTKNETKNIARFIECYLQAGVDEIIVSDAGSEDDTVFIAKSYDKVKVIHYDERVKMENGLWRSPNGAHWNFIIDHAIADGADWLLHEDADSVPNKCLQDTLRITLGILSDNETKVAMAYRIYMWGDNQYFPDLNKPGQNLFAFTPDSGIRFKEGHPWHTDLVDRGPLKNAYKFEKPEVLLHYFCPDIETTEKKMKFYIDSGQIPGYLHPLESCGRLSKIKPWMVWK